MKIVGIQHLSQEQIQQELQGGARFVIYQYCISVLVMTFKRSSNIHFVPAGRSAAAKGTPFVLASLVLGWWGIPWGPIWTISTVAKNLGGGTDVTAEVLSAQRSAEPIPRAPGHA